MPKHETAPAAVPLARLDKLEALIAEVEQRDSARRCDASQAHELWKEAGERIAKLEKWQKEADKRLRDEEFFTVAAERRADKAEARCRELEQAQNECDEARRQLLEANDVRDELSERLKIAGEDRLRLQCRCEELKAALSLAAHTLLAHGALGLPAHRVAAALEQAEAALCEERN